MKTIPAFLFAATLACGTIPAFAQDQAKPVPPPPPPAPDAAKPDANPPLAPLPPNPGATVPGSPNPDGRHNRPWPPEGGRHGGYPDMERRSEGWHHTQGAWQLPSPPAPPKPTSYIGVITTPPPAVLTAQLGLAEGFGLVVGDVLPDSPAAKAGIQRYDVLTKFNDQQLVDSSQFSTLVRALKKDTDATVTLIRKAQEQTVTVKIDERLLPERRPFPESHHYQGSIDRGPMVRGYALRGPDFQGGPDENSKVWQKNPASENPQSSDGPVIAAGAPIPPEEILREVRPGGVAQIRLLQPGGVVTYNMANARLVMKDDSGEIELTTHDGKRSLVARDAQGNAVFDGPIDTPEQRKALPEDIRKKLELIEVQQRLALEAPPLPPEPKADGDIQ